MQPVQYHRDGLQQYIFFPLDGIPEGEYINRLFQYHEIPGFLNYKIKEIDNQYYIYYLLKYKTSIGFLKEHLSFKGDIVEEMVRSIIDILQTSQNYLLSYEHIIWSVDCVFLQVETGQLQFCYCPVRLDDNDICSFLSELIQLIGKTNEKAMVFLLQLYNCVTEPGFQEKQLKDFGEKLIRKQEEEGMQENVSEISYAIKSNPDPEYKKEEICMNQKAVVNKKECKQKKGFQNVLMIFMVIVNVVFLFLLLSGILDNDYFPVLIVLFILLCGIMIFSLSGKKEDESDVIMRDYFQNMENEEYPAKDTILHRQNHEEKEKNDLYGETTILDMNRGENKLTVVEEYPGELYLFPCKKEKYPVLEVKNHSVVIGCMKEHCDYVLKERGVSRLHAKIMRMETMLYLLDLNSTNGTFLNGERIESGKDYLLEKGDVVAFSQIEFYVGEKPDEKEIY